MRVGDPVPPPDPARLGTPLVVRAHADGWVQQISRRAVIGAVSYGSTVRLDTRVGAYLVRDTRTGASCSPRGISTMSSTSRTL
jgi:hypothetical protein